MANRRGQNESGIEAPRACAACSAARDVVRERPPDEGGEHDRDAHQPDDQDTEGAEAAGDLATRRSVRQQSDADRASCGAIGSSGHGHPPVVMPLTSVADSVTDRARLPTPMMPRSWVGMR